MNRRHSITVRPYRRTNRTPRRRRPVRGLAVRTHLLFDREIGDLITAALDVLLAEEIDRAIVSGELVLGADPALGGLAPAGDDLVLIDRIVAREVSA